MPNINPDFGAPGSSALVTLASWGLGLATIVAFIALILAIVTLATKGFGHQGVQQFAGRAFGWVALGTAMLGSASAVFQLIVGFDLGLS